MASQQYTHWIPMQTDPYSSARKGAYVEVGQVPSEEVPAYRQQSFRQKYLGGVKRTLRAFVAVACLVLITNVSWLGYAKAKYGITDGFGTVRRGECSDVKSLNTWLHFAINVLSTLLLTGSNAFMAAFSCPSREEVDKAHQKGRFLHVGSFSLGNLRGIAKRKGLVVLVLALSSAPFHLLYNSLVFTSLSTNEYYWSVVTEDFLTGASFNLTGNWVNASDVYSYEGIEPRFNASLPDGTSTYSCGGGDYACWLNFEKVMNDEFTSIQQSAPSWQRLENKECIEAYSNVFLSERRNVVLVSSTTNDTNSMLQYGSADFDYGSDLDSNWWICSMGGQDGGYLKCNPEDYTSAASSWSVWGYPIEYCLSQETKDICTVEFSQTIMYVVVGFNALKVLLMIFVLFRYDAEQILTSVGDAAASFLRFEDQTTMMMCLANKREMRTFWQSRGFARPFQRRARHWGSAVSKKRLFLFFSLMLLSFLIVAFFAIWGFAHINDRGVSLSPISLWQLGFGTINQNTLVLADPGSSPVTMAIIANIPQVFLALIYILYMGIMTTMFLAADWATFAFKAQTLMVSTPAGAQRGTWLLGAPLGWGVALLTLQTLLHWFVSQSIFVVQTSVYNKDGTPKVPDPSTYPDNATFSNCGYSPIAIIFSVVAAGILMLSAIIFLLRRFPAGAPPVVGTCSAAISAACHPVGRKEVEKMVYKELRWGVDGGFSNGVGHCSLVLQEAFDTGKSWEPRDRYSYAGYHRES